MALSVAWSTTLAGEEAGQGWLDLLSRAFVENEDDAGNMAMQLIILDLMFSWELLFEYVQWREMATAMPGWDPRFHGAARWSWWFFGLPAVWFSSEETYKQLTKYIAKADPCSTSVVIQPQELAFYALSGEDERQELSRALKYTKLFDATTQDFDTVAGAAALDIDLCFFDNKRMHRATNGELCKHPGEFHSFQGDETLAMGGVVSVDAGRWTVVCSGRA